MLLPLLLRSPSPPVIGIELGLATGVLESFKVLVLHRACKTGHVQRVHRLLDGKATLQPSQPGYHAEAAGLGGVEESPHQHGQAGVTT